MAVKPGSDPNVNQPIAQTYIVVVDVLDGDDGLCPGTMAKAKVHLQKRSLAWWCWRSLASALDFGLW